MARRALGELLGAGASPASTSSSKDKAKIVEQEARIARQDKLLDQQIDFVRDATRKLTAAEQERDALRDQMKALRGPPPDVLDKKIGRAHV